MQTKEKNLANVEFHQKDHDGSDREDGVEADEEDEDEEEEEEDEGIQMKAEGCGSNSIEDGSANGHSMSNFRITCRRKRQREAVNPNVSFRVNRDKSEDDIREGSTSDYYIKSSNGCVLIDVGGVLHRVRIANFRQASQPNPIFPDSRLVRLFRAKTRKEVLRFCDGLSADEDPPTIFFDRNANGFNTVLDVYRTGKLHFTDKSCALVLKNDFDYWGIDEMLLEPCCALKYYPEMEVCYKEQEGERKAKQRMIEKLIEEDFGEHCLGRLRSKLWNLTEYPESGLDAQIAAFFSLAVIVVSTITFVLGTLEEFQEPDDYIDNDDLAARNATRMFDEEVTRYPVVIRILDIVDTICVAYFTMEYSVRLACAPKKIRFMLQPMNLVDLFAIVPLFLTIFLHRLEDIQIIGKAGKIIRLVRIMRILRVFKLVRHFAGLQSLIHTMHQAYKELGLLLFLISVTVLTVSCLVYFAERDRGVWSFVDSFWFALMTLTTVGYDLNPGTMLGKCQKSSATKCYSGISYYKNRLWRNEVAMKKRERLMKGGEMARHLTEHLTAANSGLTAQQLARFGLSRAGQTSASAPAGLFDLKLP